MNRASFPRVREVFHEAMAHVDEANELRMMPASGGTSRVLARGGTTPVAPSRAAVSPNGRWVAYQTSAAGRVEVWVDSLAVPGRPVQVSPAGGVQPTWRADGRELYFLALDGTLRSVGVSDGADLQPSPARVLFQTGLAAAGVLQQYQAAPGGDRFLLLHPQPVTERLRIDLFLGLSAQRAGDVHRPSRLRNTPACAVHLLHPGA